MEESTPTEAMEEPTATAEEGEGETPEAESTPEGQFPVTVVEVTDEYRVVQDAFGEVQVPLNPERIIVMDEPTLDTVLSFGITPVGTLMRNGEFPPYILDRLEGVESIGEMNTAFNLETIISLEPDLILVADFWEPELYDQLREIAPTVSWPAWADPIVTTQVVGVILGREDEAEEIIAAYEEKVANARAALDEAIGDQPVAVMRFFAGQVEMPPGEGTNFFYNDLGLTPTQFNSGTEFVYPSLEVMPEINAEYIFFYNEDEAIFDEITNDPLWQTIPAVQNDQVYLVHWSFDNSALLGREILTEQILSDLGVEA
jgi:iron complex transport system substrate-binding protein